MCDAEEREEERTAPPPNCWGLSPDSAPRDPQQETCRAPRWGHMKIKVFTATSFLDPPLLSPQPLPWDPLSITGLGPPGWGQKNILEGQIREGGQQNLSRGPESWKGLTHLPTRCTNTWAASSSSPRTMESRQRCEGLGEEGVHKHVEGGHLGKFGEGANSELSTFFLLFFFLRNFFSLSADDFTISWGGGWGERFFCAYRPRFFFR